MSKSEGPIRTCVGGGGQAHQDTMERFVFDERTGLIFDVRKKAPGRGGWLSVSRETLKKAVNGGFSRTFQAKVPVPSVDELAKTMADGIALRLSEHIRVAVRSRKAWIGAPLLQDGMRNDLVELVIVASDAGESTRKKFASNADRKDLAVVEALDTEKLGVLAGRDRVSVMGVSGPMAKKIEVDVAHLQTLNAFEG